jgi:hypothetical protein
VRRSGLGRTRKLHQRFKRVPAGIVFGLCSFPYSSVAPFTSQDFSNTTKAIQYAIPNRIQGFFGEPYDNNTVTETRNILLPFSGTALRQLNHAFT